jgi:hypothetical protein
MPDLAGLVGVAAAITALITILLGIAWLVQGRNKRGKDRYNDICHKKYAEAWPRSAIPMEPPPKYNAQAYGPGSGTSRGFQMQHDGPSRYRTETGEVDPYCLSSKLSMGSLRPARFHGRPNSQPGDILFAPRRSGVREPDNWV